MSGLYGQSINVQTVEDLDKLFDLVGQAQEEMLKLNQEQVDKIFRAAAFAANNMRIPLAQEAAEETSIGIVEDKVIKNNFASEYIYNKFKNMKTAGIIEEDTVNGIMTIAEPLGTLAGIIPTTNPTSTAIFKALIALKTRNTIIFSPHPRAAKCTMHACQIVRDAAIAAGAPANCVAYITHPSVELSGILMKHPKTACILATGGGAMVKAAYSSGNPAIGVGPGNCAALIDEYADIQDAVSCVIVGKSFDNGVICASEQAMIVVDQVYDQVKAELEKRGAFILSPEDKIKIGDLILPVNEKTGKRALNARVVGRPARELAEAVGIKVPAEHPCRLLVGEFDHVGFDEPFSQEKLMPCCGLYHATDFENAVTVCEAMINLAGRGHTSAIHTSFERQDRIKYYASRVATGRVIVNSPSTHGALGDIYNFRMEPSLTLGCGSHGGNAVSENVAPKHLLNIKKVAQKRENTLWFKAPPSVYFKYGCLEESLKELYVHKKAFIISDKILFDLGYLDRVTKPLEQNGIRCQIFTDVKPDPDLDCCYSALKGIQSFKPDLLIAVGGGSAMDLMKMARMLYEHPDTDFEGANQRFMDIRKRIYVFPEMREHYKTKSVCIPTTSGTGSEVTSFAVITDEKTGVKYPLADYELMPQMAIVDSSLAMTMPKFLAAWTGLDALTHAIEAYVSILSTEFTAPLCLQACKMVFDNLEESVNQVTKKSREALHHAATIAGMAFSNAFLGINHSLAHKMGQKFHVPHGLANAILLTTVIRYNAVSNPQKMGLFPQYKYPQALERYAEIADFCGFTKPGMTAEEKKEALCDAIDALMAKVGVVPHVSAFRNAPTKEEYFAALPQLSVYAFDDQCTSANPRYPLISEIQEIYEKVW